MDYCLLYKDFRNVKNYGKSARVVGRQPRRNFSTASSNVSFVYFYVKAECNF